MSMSIATYIFGVVSALITLGVVIEMLRRRRLRERHAVWWLVAGTLGIRNGWARLSLCHRSLRLVGRFGRFGGRCGGLGRVRARRS